MQESVRAETAVRLATLVGRFNRRFRTATGGLSHGLLSALASVTKRGPVRLADLAQVELVSAPGITRMVAELEARGLVVRTADPQDGRAVLIEVTDAGTDAVRLARSARANVVSELLLVLDADEIAAVEAAIPALERMIGEG